MGWLLWATVVTTWAIHTGLHRWKRVRGRRRQTASSQRAISRQAVARSISNISLLTFGPAKESGTPSIRTATYLPFNLPRPPGLTPPHIPEQRIRYGPPMLVQTSHGLYYTLTPEVPEAGPTAGSEAPSHD